MGEGKWCGSACDPESPHVAEFWLSLSLPLYFHLQAIASFQKWINYGLRHVIYRTEREMVKSKGKRSVSVGPFE